MKSANQNIEPFLPAADLFAGGMLIVPCLLIVTFVGCGESDQLTVQRRPRPVATQTLVMRPAPSNALVTASAGAWKTEDLGFEVSGRIEYVADQNTEIEGRIRDASGDLIIAGTPIARIESERYELAVARAKAAVAQAKQDLIVAQTDLDETIPAKIDAANASVELAKIQFERSKRLQSQNAGSQSELDSAKASYENATAELRQLIAAEKSQKSQIESVKNAVLQAQQSLRDADRDLEDCTLFSSFGGKVAETAVVPGSLVSAGSPVATIQMMDPIKIELEVSGEQSRRLQRAETLPVHVAMPDGSTKVLDGFLHQIDPSADPETRTFTLTILVLNQQLLNDAGSDVATTQDIWRLDLKFIPGAKPGDLYIEENSILRDDQGAYLWQITNANAQSRTPPDHLFSVKKLRVTPGPTKVPYLGDYIFQQVTVQDSSFDPQRDIVIGELNVPEKPANQWNGNQVLLDSPSRWMLRPGDLVKVDLSDSSNRPGFYVPMDAIVRKAGESFLFQIVGQDDSTIVKQVPVRVAQPTLGSTLSRLRRVESVGEQTLDGIQFVTQGTHFLMNGERVKALADSKVDS